MNSYPEFDSLNSPLEGRNLIEASAGTGKTYSICRIFLRILLEKCIEAKNILVVTFTDAAAQELRERIFLLLRQTLSAFELNETTDPLLQKLLKNVDPTEAKALLLNALRDFDGVPVHTIHGFCQHLLASHSFETGASFEEELITDQSLLLQEIAQDFWRTCFYRSSPLFVAYTLSCQVDVGTFLGLLNKGILLQRPRIIPIVKEIRPEGTEQEFLEILSEVKSMWPEVAPRLPQLLSRDRMNGVKYSGSIVGRIVSSMDQFVKGHYVSPILFNDFDKLTATVIQSAVRKGQEAPSDPFFLLCDTLKQKADQLLTIFENNLLYCKENFISYAREELRRRKRDQNVVFFDDILENVHEALKDPDRGLEFQRIIAHDFKAAMIDEFQDTDPLQYEIFNALFPPGSLLYLIGDPKQAIYSFRGADIFAYLSASEKVDKRYTLRENYRSDPKLVAAVNALFSINKNPFIFHKIGYTPIKANDKNSQFLIIDDVKSDHFTLLLSENKSLKKPDMATVKQFVADAVGSQVANLVLLGTQKRALIGSTPITPSDIVILVRTNREAQLMQQALTKNNIPSVLDSNGSVFQTHEATELLRVLSAFAHPNSHGMIRAALSTSYFGYDAITIERLACDETRWDRLFDSFGVYRERWKEKGFISMISSFAIEQGVRSRLLILDRGERRLTNFLHLIELIHNEEQRALSGTEQTLNWLQEKIIDCSDNVPDEDMIRLESDEDSVRVVTIHKSKGLEYPVVFCPFNWQGSEVNQRKRKNPYLFHDPVNSYKLTYALGRLEIEENYPTAEKELLAENMRLLYVALTRAKVACFLVWGKLPGAETSAPSYLMNFENDEDFTIQELSATVRNQPENEFIQKLESKVRESNGSLALRPLSVMEASSVKGLKNPETSLEVKELPPSIPEPWRVTSFSSLTSRSHLLRQTELLTAAADTAALEHEAVPDLAPEKEELRGIASFPRGAQAGTFFHELLEEIDFTKVRDKETLVLVGEKLKNYGFELSWREEVWETLRRVIETPLNGELSLAQIGKPETLREFEFYLPLKKVEPDTFNTLFINDLQYLGESLSGGYGAEGLDFSPVGGYLKGFIDLIFWREGKYYLIDWKSNFLGPSPESYSPEALRRTMCEEHYVLQYHLYTAALVRFLKFRLHNFDYKANFGGVFYVFLRGIDQSIHPSPGIYFALPEPSILEKLFDLMKPE